MTPRRLGVGVVGLGRAFTLMLPTFTADPRVRLVAGCDPRRLVHQAMITPACGLVGLDVAQAAHVLVLTNLLAQRVADRAGELALTLGA